MKDINLGPGAELDPVPTHTAPDADEGREPFLQRWTKGSRSLCFGRPGSDSRPKNSGVPGYPVIKVGGGDVEVSVHPLFRVKVLFSSGEGKVSKEVPGPQKTHGGCWVHGKI